MDNLWITRRELLALLGSGVLFTSRERPPLTEALARLGPEARRVPLLAVCYEELAHGESTPLPAGSLTLAQLAAAYERKVSRCGSLIALTPTQMDVLEPDGPIPLAADMGEIDRLRLLLASLEPGQWSRLVSDSGLAQSSLDETQQALLAGVLNPLALLRQRTTGETIRLRSAEKAQLQLRLKAIVWARIGTIMERVEDATGARVLTPRELEPKKHLWEGEEGEDPTTLPRLVPVQNKPSDLEGRAPLWQKPVSLSGVATVGEALRRVVTATGQELYADPRVASLPLWFAGTRAVYAGDVLRALALSVTGTYRKLGPAYVLTDDLVGIGTRMAVLHERRRAAEYRIEQLSQEAEERLKQVRTTIPPASWVTPLLSEGLYQRLLRPNPIIAEARDERANGLAFARTALPAPLLSVIEKELRAEDERLHPEEPVRLQPTLGLYLTLPGQADVLSIEVPPEDSLNDLLYRRPSPTVAAAPASSATIEPVRPPLRWPTVTIDRTLLIAPDEPGEARRFAQLAQRYGFTRLVVQGDAASWVAAQEASVPIWGIVPLLVASRPEWADLTLRGESTDSFATRTLAAALGKDPAFQTALTACRYRLTWARFDLTEVRTAVLERLRKAATVPGLAGLLATHALPPGYESAGEAEQSASALTMSGPLGYTEPQRLAFLRKAGYDPLDLCPLSPQDAAVGFTMGLDPGLRFFRHDDTPVGEWARFRRDRLAAFLNEAREATAQAAPHLGLERAERLSPQEPGLVLRAWSAQFDEGPLRFALRLSPQQRPSALRESLVSLMTLPSVTLDARSLRQPELEALLSRVISSGAG